MSQIPIISKNQFFKLLKKTDKMPAGNYSSIKEIPYGVSFCDGCVFGDNTVFEGKNVVKCAVLGDNIEAVDGSEFYGCSFGNNCRITDSVLHECRFFCNTWILDSVLSWVEVGDACAIGHSIISDGFLSGSLCRLYSCQFLTCDVFLGMHNSIVNCNTSKASFDLKPGVEPNMEARLLS